MATIPDQYRDLFGPPHFAHIATINADGSPQSTPVWVHLDGDGVIFNTAEGRRKTLNLRRDPRIALSIHDHGNPYRYVEVRGRARLEPDPDCAGIDAMAKRYLGVDEYPYKSPSEQRVTVHVTVDHISGMA